MRTLVVTGGIGSGKSIVCRYLALKGIPVYDSDSRARNLYEDKTFVSRLEQALGCTVTGADGRVDTAKLSSVIFSDPLRLNTLESIVHPAVKEDFIRWRLSFPEGSVPFVILESAIILEKPLFKDIADKVLLVDAPLQTRLERACSRDGVSRDRILERMKGQKLLNDLSEGKTDPRVDFIIRNTAGPASLFAQADAVYAAMCNAI